MKTIWQWIKRPGQRTGICKRPLANRTEGARDRERTFRKTKETGGERDRRGSIGLAWIWETSRWRAWICGLGHLICSHMLVIYGYLAEQVQLRA